MKIRKIGKREDAAHGQYHVVITISNVILCAIAVICMLTVMFTWFQNYMQEEITKLSYTQLGNTVQSTENRLDYYQMQLQNLFQEPQIKASLYTNEEGPIHEFNIYRFLNYSIVNDQIIDYALIYKDNKIKQFVGTVYPGEEELDTIVEYLNQSQNDMEIYQYYNEKAKTSRLYLFRTERDVLNGPPKRGLLFAVNQEKLAKSLFGDEDEAAEQNIWVFDGAGHILMKHVDSAEMITDEVWEQIQNEPEDRGAYEIQTEGETFSLVYRKGTSYQLKFVQMIDTSSITGTLAQALRLALIGAVIILALCSAASFIAVKYILYPLREFMQKLTVSAGLSEKNGENDQLTLITSERILSEISSMSRQLHTDKVMAYLEDADSDAVPPKPLLLAEHAEEAVLVFIGSKIGRIHARQLEELKTTLRQSFPVEISVNLYSEESRSYGILILTEKIAGEQHNLRDRTFIETGLRQILCRIDMSEGSLYAIFSESTKTAQRLQVECRQLKTLAKYVLFGDFDTISCAVDYSEKVDEEIPKKSLEKLVSVVKSGNDVEAKSLMPGILNSVSQYEIKRIFCALSYLAAEIEQVYDQFSSRAREYQGLYLEHYIKLTSLVNQKELYDYFSNIIEDACLEMRTSNERSLRTTMLDSIRYIEEHYTDPDLSVDKIATIFHISNSYFSRMFHEICNLSFPEYVNELRLNYSAQLLQTTNLNVKEIAARSGFSGVSYFGAQFKKKYGVSPSVFRGKQASKV